MHEHYPLNNEKEKSYPGYESIYFTPDEAKKKLIDLGYQEPFSEIGKSVVTDLLSGLKRIALSKGDNKISLGHQMFLVRSRLSMSHLGGWV